MKNIWLAISRIDDHELLVEGVFDNQSAAEECLKYEGPNLNPLVYRIDLSKIRSKYISQIETN
ncbi:hypothetical protein MCEZE4_01607 [Burkholderiaceae bacterium]